MSGPGSARRLLGVFAHPDDEVFCAGGTMARAARAGAEVMVVSATRGEQGQIRDPAAASRQTLGAVRERELWAAAAELGVQQVRVLGYPDGALQEYPSSLDAEVREILRQFDPDTVVTFGPDGGYGHPDHIAISEATTEAFKSQACGHNPGRRLFHAVFPPRPTSIAEELAHWIINSGQPATGRAALQAIALFASASATLRLARDDVRVEWFPPGISVVEPGEPADALYLILDGSAETQVEQPDGEVVRWRRMEPGDFFGERGLLGGQGMAHVVARSSLTCLVLSRTPTSPHAGRGVGARRTPEQPGTPTPLATGAVDVTGCVDRKLAALARHQTQYPTCFSMLPGSLLQKVLGTEFFRRAATTGSMAPAEVNLFAGAG